MGRLIHVYLDMDNFDLEVEIDQPRIDSDYIDKDKKIKREKQLKKSVDHIIKIKKVNQNTTIEELIE